MSYTLPLTFNNNYATGLAYLFPDVAPRDGWSLNDNGNGTVDLTAWNLPGDPPDQTAIDAAIAAHNWVIVQNQMEVLRQYSDKVFVRCGKLGIAYPQGWIDYDEDVEDVLNQADPLAITWPTVPALPSGVIA